jgi:mannose-6-phosphate isomerase-like protein (cupin superfamily)
MFKMYDPYRRYPANGPSQGNNRYGNYPMQGSNRYVNYPMQGNYGYANNPQQANYGYANNQQQANYGYANNQQQANYGYTNDQRQANYGYANDRQQANNNYINNNRMNAQGAGRPAGNAALADIKLVDNGPEPYVVNIEEAAKQNNNFRTALWTGEHLQLTLMSINPGEDIGFEVHPNLDQFIRIEDGIGIAVMGDQKENLDFQRNVSANDALIIPAGKWHNLVNAGRKPLKLYSIYAPPQHPFGTVQATKEEAKAAEAGTE